MRECGKNGEENDDHQRSHGASNREETNQAYLCEIYACYQVLEGSRVDKPLRVNLHVINKQEIVPVRLVNQVEP